MSLLGAILAAAVAAGPATSAQEFFDKGNDAYLKEDYEEAVKLYGAALESGVQNADLYFNLGNACYRAGKIGPAVLYYEKALRLSPGDDDIRFNLSQARQRNIDKLVVGEGGEIAAATGFLENLFSRFSTDFSTTAFLVFYLGFFVLLLAAWRVRKELLRRNLAVAAITFCIVWVLAALFLAAQVHYTEGVRRAVVLSERVEVREGPGDVFKSAFEVHAGLKVRLLDTEGKFSRIRLANGLSGWAPSDALGEI